jgi:nucleotide-binding universal stress UspA family protein
MSDIHEILVAIDFSEGSKAALEQAAFIAEQVGANLHVLHVWQVPEFVPPNLGSGGPALAALGKLVESHANEELAKFVADARTRGITVSHAFTELGVPSSTIVEVARRQKYELVVMGTNGRTGLAHALVGSVAERVVRRAPCPVVTVREPAAERAPSIKRVLAPVDYSEGSRRALDWAARLARSFGAELDVVHVWDRPSYVPGDTVVHGPGDTRRSLGELIRQNAEAQMKDFLASFSASHGEGTREFPAHRLLSGEPASTLIRELEKGEHDLVIVGTHGRTGFKHFLLGSVAENLVRYSRVPVVTVPPLAAPPT